MSREVSRWCSKMETVFICAAKEETDFATLLTQEPELGENKPSPAQLFFYTASKRHNPRAWLLEKTSSHVFHIDTIRDQFPKARIMLCTRDPIDLAISYRKRLVKERGMGTPEGMISWLNLSATGMAQKFKAVKKSFGKAQQQHCVRVFLVPYDFQTSDPDKAKRCLCDCLSADLSELAPRFPKKQWSDMLLARNIVYTPPP